MRVVFLDIDGVLNSEAFLRTREEQHCQLGHHGSCECWLEQQIDRAAVIRLNRLVFVTGAKIVVSSSWRLWMSLAEVARVLVEHGLLAEIVGETPDLANERRRAQSFDERVADGLIDLIERGHEIDEWMRRNPGVQRFVILDDRSDMAMHKNRLVQTGCEDGLQDEHVNLAIRMMSWDGKAVPSPLDDMGAG